MSGKQLFAPPSSYDTIIDSGDKAREMLASRVSELAKTVARTMGPNGAPAMLDRPKKVPTVTKDGVTVLYDLDSGEEDKVKSVVYELMRAAAEHVSKEAGDGTTSVCWLIARWVEELQVRLSAGWNHRELLEGFNLACTWVLENIKALSVEANSEKPLRAALNTAANGEEEVIDTLVDVFLDVGDEGMMFIRDAQGTHTKVLFEEGTDLPAKLDNPELLDQTSLQREFKNPYMLVTINQIDSPWDLVPIMEDIATRGEAKELIIAYSEMSDDTKRFLYKNNSTPGTPVKVASFRMPLYTDRQRAYLEDMAAITDATLVDKRAGMNIRKLGIEQLGRAEDVMVTSTMVRIINGKGSKTIIEGKSRLARRIEEVTAERDMFTGNIDERTRLNERLARMTGAVVSICPGGRSRAEIVRKRGVYEDAIKAGHAALKSGIVPGAGWAPYNIARAYKPEDIDTAQKAGIEAACLGFMSIFEKLTRDAGLNPQLVADKLTSIDPNNDMQVTINLKTQETGNFIDIKVVDPVLLHEVVITQAQSTATALMSVECVLTHEPTEEYKKFKEQQKFEHLRA